MRSGSNKFTAALSLVVVLVSTSVAAQHNNNIIILGNSADLCTGWNINESVNSKMGAWTLGYVVGAIRYAHGNDLYLSAIPVFS